MNYEQLKEVTDTIKGSTFASIDTETSVKLTGGKKNPLQDKITKTTKGVNVILFGGTDQSGYENMIKRRLADEGKDPDSFTLGARAWGTRVGQSPIIEHNGKYYLECIFVNPGKSVYLNEGVEINKEDIQGLPETKEKEPAKEGEALGNSDLENKVVIRTFSLDSIKAIRLKGKELI